MWSRETSARRSARDGLVRWKHCALGGGAVAWAARDGDGGDRPGRARLRTCWGIAQLVRGARRAWTDLLCSAVRSSAAAVRRCREPLL
jgi:hypothetical protein